VLQKKLALVIFPGMLLLSACADLNAVSVEDSCSWVRPIIVSEYDLGEASDELLTRILIHNELWEINCTK
jgi:hypothetical protein